VPSETEREPRQRAYRDADTTVRARPHQSLHAQPPTRSRQRHRQLLRSISGRHSASSPRTLAFQISSLYSWTQRSDEKRPMRAVVRMHLRSHDSFCARRQRDAVR